jgi:hypothetical protein
MRAKTNLPFVEVNQLSNSLPFFIKKIVIIYDEIKERNIKSSGLGACYMLALCEPESESSLFFDLKTIWQT